MRKEKVCPFLTSVLMSVVLVLGSFASLVHASEYPVPTNGNNSETERVYEGDGYKVTFSLVSSWNSGYNLGVEIENIGREPILNWHLSFDYAGEITNIWCAEIQETTDDGYIVKNVSYNMDIAPGGSTSFGISENTPFPGFPDNAFIPGADNETVTGDHSVVYTVENDWGDGFVGNICITNNTGSVINDWSLAFDFDREIISVWGGVIESSENGHYVVRHAVDNPDILPGQSVSFGMIGSGGTRSDEPENYDLTSYTVGDVQVVDPDADTDGDGLTDNLEEAIGTDPELPDTDGDGLSDYQEIYLTWTDPLLVDTDNNGISDANEDLDGDGLGNLDEIIRGTDTGNPDTDRDDLSDFDEIYEFGTDPLNPDSDGDTLSDGDDVLLGFSPLLPDTDYNGILDCNEQVYQTAENDFPLGDGRGITNVSVSMNISGNIEKEVGILNMYDFDVQSREVVGLIGVPMEIRTDVVFDSATITFTYDESMLGDTPEENLSIMWYDEENRWYQILDQESVVDTVNNTVSYTTSHFSTYLLVDWLKWYNFWTSQEYGDYLEQSPALIGDSIYYVYYYEIARDRVGRVNYGDLCQYPSFNTFCALHGSVKLSQTSFGNNMFSQIIMYDYINDPEGYMDRVSCATYLDNVYPSVIWFNELIESTISEMEYHEFENQYAMASVIVVNDGLLQIEQRTIDKCIANNIQINVIDYFYPSSSPSLGLAALQTGGKYYNAQYGVDNEKVAEELGKTALLNSGYDGDEDNIADYYEEYGMICSNGKILFSDPNNAHSDNDGLKDGQEVEMTTDVVRYVGGGKNPTIRYFVEHSDPLKEDTDGDGINDNIDSQPMLNIAKEVNISSIFPNVIYLNIDPDSFDGGDQHWWYARGNCWNYDHNYSNFAKYADFRTGWLGCGVIAMSDLEIYLAQNYGYINSRYGTFHSIPDYDQNGMISKDEYMEYADFNRELVYCLNSGVKYYRNGVLETDLVKGLNDFMIANGNYFSGITWAKYYNKEKIILSIKEMINNNLPIVFAYNSYPSADEIYLYSDMYDAITDKGKDYCQYYSDGHYMSIVGYVIYCYGNSEEKYLLRVESNGDLFYINFDEYAKKISYSNNLLLYSI